MKSYIIEKVVLRNAVKLKLIAFIRIYLVVNINKIVRYKKLIKKQKMEKLKLVKVNSIGATR